MQWEEVWQGRCKGTRRVVFFTHLCPFSKSKFNLKSDRVNLLSYCVSALLTQCPGDAVQTGTRKVDQARKFKFSTAARDPMSGRYSTNWDRKGWP